MNRYKIKIGILIFILLELFSCSSKKMEISSNGDLDDVILFAIKDYSKFASRKHSDKTIFFVDIKQINPDFYSFSISPSFNEMIYNEKYLKDSDIEKLPSNYFVINKQLYYWWIDGKKGKKSDIEIFKKYRLLIDDKEAYEFYSNTSIDELQKITYYYFCKKDFKKFIKINSSSNNDYFNIPKNFNCKE